MGATMHTTGHDVAKRERVMYQSGRRPDKQKVSQRQQLSLKRVKSREENDLTWVVDAKGSNYSSQGQPIVTALSVFYS